MNVTVNARHMEITDALREYVEKKIAKLPKYYDNIDAIDIVLDVEGGQPAVEIKAHARRRQTFVAHHRVDNTNGREGDMYSAIDGCVEKAAEQIRRHKDKVRDRHVDKPQA